jgi:hypothetical protein
VIDLDPFGLDAQAEQGVALGGEVLLIGGASGVPDKQRAHGAPPELGATVPQDAVGSGIGRVPDAIITRRQRCARKSSSGPQRDPPPATTRYATWRSLELFRS